ncbi:MAG: S8 family serine peptidase [Candidatus Zixiibacteriota bacterium]
MLAIEKKSALFAALILILACFTASIAAGVISESLEAKLTDSRADDFIRVIIAPKSMHNAAAMKAALARDYATRAERHQAAMFELKAVAEQSQVELKSILAEMESAGTARNIKAFWIDNIIEAELTISAIEDINGLADVEKISLYPEIVSMASIKGATTPLSIASAQSNLTAVNAPASWAMGYDGSGRIVCSFDSGVDGAHPALINNYRGNKGFPAAECWFSPIDTSSYPRTYAGQSSAHGTHTTGIMVGHDDATGDTVGVAPGADWIAAAAIDVPGVSIFQAFQWAADPDGNPNTVSDLPDVINNSWGIQEIGCSDVLWNVIDNVEALGVVVIFAAGNEGPFDTLRNPANRADDSLTNFAVGAWVEEDSLWYRSAQGPSDCDGVSIKPNVVAPGLNIVSSVPGGSYLPNTGTSMACPHVAGAIAILRQKNPDATVDQIKTALLNSAIDQGVAGKDNKFGWGLIDIVAALNELDALTAPSLQVAGFDKTEFNPGGIYSLSVSLKNVGANATNVNATFTSAETGILSFSPSLGFGDILSGATITSGATFDIHFDDTASPGVFYSVDMTITADGGYSKDMRLSFFLGPEGQRTFYDHINGQIKFTISNFGAYGFHNDGYTPYGYLGFQYGIDTAYTLYEGAFLIGTDSAHISDCARNVAQEPDNDFNVIGGGSIESEAPGRYADQETTSLFDDSYAEHPLGLTIKQRSYAWTDAPDLDFVILEYIITNSSGSTITNLRAGMYMDWDVVFYSQNRSDYDATEEVGYIYHPNTGKYRGVGVLNPEGLINHRPFIVGAEVSGSLFDEGQKALGLFDDSRLSWTSTSTDLSHITATGPFTLAPGATDTAAFAIIGGDTWTDFIGAVVRARQVYADLPTDVDDEGGALPHTFTLAQNVPNPFNPTTSISFTLPKSGTVKAEVFDILGREVKLLTNSFYQTGEHHLIWDGTDNDGNRVATGVYFYRILFDNTSLTKQMILMK